MNALYFGSPRTPLFALPWSHSGSLETINLPKSKTIFLSQLIVVFPSADDGTSAILGASIEISNFIRFNTLDKPEAVRLATLLVAFAISSAKSPRTSEVSSSDAGFSKNPVIESMKRFSTTKNVGAAITTAFES